MARTLSPKSFKYGAYVDWDNFPLGFVQSRYPFIVVTLWNDCLAWTEHRTLSGAKRKAKTDKGVAAQFNPFGNSPRWETV